MEREITVTRVFAAPRALVFSMFTDAKHLAAWWGPHSWDNPVCEADPRPGGKILIHMRGPGRHRAPDGRRLRRDRAARAHRVHDLRRHAGRQSHHRVAQHGAVRGERRQDQGDPARARRRLHRFLGEHAGRHGGGLVAEPRQARRACGAHRTATRMPTIRRRSARCSATAPTRCSARSRISRSSIWRDDVVSYDLDPPLQHLGPNKAALQAWFDTWEGPIGWAMGDLTVEVGGDVAFAYGLGHMTGTKKGGDEGRRLDARHRRLRAPKRRLEDHAPAQLGAVPDGRQLQGRGRSQAVTNNASKREQRCRKSLRSCGSTVRPKRR